MRFDFEMVSGSLYGCGDTVVLKRCNLLGVLTMRAKGGGGAHVLYGICVTTTTSILALIGNLVCFCYCIHEYPSENVQIHVNPNWKPSLKAKLLIQACIKELDD